MKKLLLVIALVVVMGLPLLAACSCGGTQLTEGDINTIKGFGARLDSLEKQIAAVKSDVNNLNPGEGTAALEEEIAAVQAGLDKLKADFNNADLADIETRVVALEDVIGAGTGNGGDGTEVGLTTRWTLAVDLEAAPSGLSIEEYSWYPTRIKDEDTYKIDIKLANDDGTAKNNQVLFISLAPANRDTSIDINNTGIYSISPINIWWDSSFSPSDGVSCRGMEFVSDPFDVPAVTEYSVKVEFDLYYD